MKDNSLENETPTEVWESLHEWEKEHNPFYPTEMRHSRESLTQFAEFYATLKTSQLREQLETYKGLADKIAALQHDLLPEGSQEEKRHYWIYERNNLLEQLEKLQEDNERKEIFGTNLLRQLEEKDREIERLKADLKYTYEYAEKQREVKQLLVDEPLANQSAAGWISVEERLPDEKTKVIGYNPTYNIWSRQHIIELVNGTWYDVYIEGEVSITQEAAVPTHWQPLPEPPSLQENTKF